MSLEILEKRVKLARANAAEYANHCKLLLANGDLAAALVYCSEASVVRPQCSVTAMTDNAEKLRAVARRKLADLSWWAKNLETEAIRRYELDQISQGRVINYVSDGLAAYHAKYKLRQ